MNDQAPTQRRPTGEVGRASTDGRGLGYRDVRCVRPRIGGNGGERRQFGLPRLFDTRPAAGQARNNIDTACRGAVQIARDQLADRNGLSAASHIAELVAVCA
jgi:hypothetical protein